MAVVKVPKTPKKSFNKSRRPSALLLDQIRHLEWAVLPASQRKPQDLPKARVRTEAEAAERIGQLTRMVLEANAARQAAEAAGTPLTTTAVKLPPILREPLPASSPAKPTVRKRTADKARRSARKKTTARSTPARSTAKRSRRRRKA